ncbi:MAG: type I-F CRISPR-associated protein Csy1, partial [Pollutimonas bauzanensis]
LYASSLAHALHSAINEDRFGDAAKAARQARRDKQDHPTGYSDYPQLLVQKLGGTKPQNVSQLNSERGGVNYLLASLPPVWKSGDLREPWRVDSVFAIFGARIPVRAAVRELKRFLKADPPETMATRNYRDELVDGIIDELVSYAGELQEGLTPGWSADALCRLPKEECLWLDIGRSKQDEGFRSEWLWFDWPLEVGKRFGNWLNGALGKNLPLGDIEQRQWRRELLTDPLWALQLDQGKRNINKVTKAAGEEA